MCDLKKKLSALVLTTLFATMQLSYAAVDTGLGSGNGGAVINGVAGNGFDPTTGVSGAGTGKVNLNFTGDAHVKWDTLNVNKGETLNFNAVNGATGLTILNTVNKGMSKIAGEINANNGISNLIISNPNGVLFNGAKFTALGDVMITTQPMTATFVNGKMDVIKEATTNSVGVVKIIGDPSTFNIGGEFNILTPKVEMIASSVTAGKGMKLITSNGQDYLSVGNSAPAADDFAVRLEAVSVNGDVYIIADKGVVKTSCGGEIKGNLKIYSDDKVALNYVDEDKLLHVTGDVDAIGNGYFMYARNTKVDGNLNMTNGGGFLEVGNVQVGKDMTLKTPRWSENQEGYKHFVHVIGNDKVAGNVKIESENNIHIGGYDFDAKQLLGGNFEVGGDLVANAINGHITTTINTSANKITLKSDNKNILTDGKAVLSANEYEFSSKGYIGGLTADSFETVDANIMDKMEHYVFIPAAPDAPSYLNITGGTISKIDTPVAASVYIASSGDVELTGANTGNINITAPEKFIEIKGEDVHAKTITVGNETKKLKVDFPKRDYELKYTNIRDSIEVVINPTDEITYELTNAENGYNDGTQLIGENTYLVGPDKPVVTPVDPVDPPVDPEEPSNSVVTRTILDPEDNDNVKVLGSYANRSVDLDQVYTPVAYAADLEDDQIDSGIRKNVDGSVTVVRAFPMDK